MFKIDNYIIFSAVWALNRPILIYPNDVVSVTELGLPGSFLVAFYQFERQSGREKRRQVFISIVRINGRDH